MPEKELKRLAKEVAPLVGLGVGLWLGYQGGWIGGLAAAWGVSRIATRIFGGGSSSSSSSGEGKYRRGK